MDMGVPPILIAALIREFRNSETVVLLDDIVTLGIRRTRSVPQDDPCAADLFGAALDKSAGKSMDTCQKKKWALPVGGYLGLLLFADNCWIIALSVAELQTMARVWYEFLKQAGLHIDWEEAVHHGARNFLAALQCRVQQSRGEHVKKVSKLLVSGSLSMATFTKEVAGREVAAKRRFFVLRHMLCNNNVALKYKW